MTGEEIEVVRHARARRARLSVDPASGRARLTLPPRASAAKALLWARDHVDWIAAQRARLPEARPFVDGAVVPFGDGALTLVWTDAPTRRVERDGERLMVGGPAETRARRVEAWLKRAALDLLSRETQEYAALADVAVTRVAIGDVRGRWGSCAAGGTIRYSWRLVLAPDAVRRATVAHEVAHRVHMDHSPRFHALVAQLYGREPVMERAWLKRNGAGLHWVGRSA